MYLFVPVEGEADLSLRSKNPVYSGIVMEKNNPIARIFARIFAQPKPRFGWVGFMGLIVTMAILVNQSLPPLANSSSTAPTWQQRP
jgi:hypothetical protein